MSGRDSPSLQGWGLTSDLSREQVWQTSGDLKDLLLIYMEVQSHWEARKSVESNSWLVQGDARFVENKWRLRVGVIDAWSGLNVFAIWTELWAQWNSRKCSGDVSTQTNITQHLRQVVLCDIKPSEIFRASLCACSSETPIIKHSTSQLLASFCFLFSCSTKKKNFTKCSAANVAPPRGRNSQPFWTVQILMTQTTWMCHVCAASVNCKLNVFKCHRAELWTG